MKSIIIGTETFTEPKAAAHKLAVLNNISVDNAEWYIIAQIDASDSFIAIMESLGKQGFDISDEVYVKTYLRTEATEDIIFSENAGLTPFDSIEDIL